MTNLVHRAVVQRIERLSPGMVRVVLGGPGLAGFVSTGVGDEYLRVWFPREGEEEPVLPTPSGNDSWAFLADVEPSPLRTYTVRAWDAEARELTVDMVVHGAGLAGRWAALAAPGSVVGVNTPRGMYAPPADLRWLLLVADAAALPAASRILEGLAPDVRVRAVFEVPGPEYRVELPQRRAMDVEWLSGGNGHGPSRIEEVVRSARFPPGTGYVWVAGETHVTRAVRKHLRRELGLPAATYKVVGYWTQDAEEWTARYEALPSDVSAHLAGLWDDAGRDEEEIEDEYDEVLTRHGL